MNAISQQVGGEGMRQVTERMQGRVVAFISRSERREM
jgi:hypothetical protein